MQTQLFNGIVLLCLASMLSPGATASQPLTSAKLTFIQHDVAIADIDVVQVGSDGLVNRRKASLNDSLGQNNALMTGRQSRAELQFNDGSITRLGQLTSFRFEPGTRNMNLRQGAALFHVPSGQTGTRIQAGPVTAAITGTTFLFQVFGDRVVLWVFEGTLTIDGVVYTPGQVVVFNNDGTTTVQDFDPNLTADQIALMTKFGGSDSQPLFSDLVRTAGDNLSLSRNQPGSGEGDPGSGQGSQYDNAVLNRLVELRRVQTEKTIPNEPYYPYGH